MSSKKRLKRRTGWFWLVGILIAFLLFQLFSLFDEPSVSSTAHYTSYIWVKHNLSPPQLRTSTGIVLFWLLEPVMMFSRSFFNGPTIENMLLARHELIDLKLIELIENKNVSQIIEIASGLSGRGYRFMKKYGKKITYYETDFPKMVALKKQYLYKSADVVPFNHKFISVNALNPSGPDSLESLFTNHIRNDQGVVVITEGLLPYFTKTETVLFWKDLSKYLSMPMFGVYLSDIYLKEDIHNDPSSQRFLKLLSLFVRKKVNSYQISKQEIGAVFFHLDGPSQVMITPPKDFSHDEQNKYKRGSEKVRVLDVRYQQVRMGLGGAA